MKYELKSHNLVDIQDYRGEVYIKSEVDKVIEELKRQIDFLKITHDACGSCNKCADGMGKVFDSTFKELNNKLKEAKNG